MELEFIQIKGARQHNLRIDELAIPKKKLVVFTGVSGSGKSSLAFDTLYAEGQRRYVESLSSYARQFLGQVDKPHVDQLRGLSPTIAIEQRTASSNPRSTVGTITEIYDYLRVLYARVGQPHCHLCGRAVRPLPTDQIVRQLREMKGQALILAPLAENRKGQFREMVEEVRKRGYARVRVDGATVRLQDDIRLDRRRKHTVELVIDRIDPAKATRARIADSVELALREGKGTLIALDSGGVAHRMSQLRACPRCGVGLPELTPQLFSFNSPLGMCQECNGIGRQMEMDCDLVIADPTKSIHQGAIAPWASIMQRRSGISYGMFVGLQKQYGLDLDCPWKDLPAGHRNLVLHGTGDERVPVKWRGRHGSVAWAMQFEGVMNILMRRYRETKSDAAREAYQEFLTDALCRRCGGARLRPEALSVRVGGASLAEVTEMPISKLSQHFRSLKLEGSAEIIACEVRREILARIDFLRSVGLDYLTLARLGPSLSSGEAQRIRLASQLGSELSGVMYVLDEPSVGLHVRDNQRLIGTLRRLRDYGNTVLVVEHDRDTIECADHVVDFGPGAGEHGGRVVFEGTPSELRDSDTLTGRYLTGRTIIPYSPQRRRRSGELTILGATEHNLKSIDVVFPLGTFTVVTGVSGAGKSSLVTGILYPALCRQLYGGKHHVGAHREIRGASAIDKTIHIDQTPIGRTPRSNCATYTNCFWFIRELFARTPDARALGHLPGRFSFNVRGGRCEACEGDGVRRVEMHFLPDVYVVCETCQGKRYNDATLAVRFKGLSIADALNLSVREALQVFSAHPQLRRILQTLSDVGLDYLKLGQSAPTLSGGEAQRVKLSRELARSNTGRTMYVLDEPTTGLHFDDIRKLLDVLNRLVDAGNTVVIIEHNMDVIRCADHVIDLGPEGGEAGGRVVATGTPEEVAVHPGSITGAYLKRVLAR